MAGSQPAEQKEKTFEIVQQPKQVAETLPSELYVPEYGITVKTDYSDPFVVRYLAGRRGMNIPRENWFGMENLGESREKIANGIINQIARGGAAAVAGGAMALYRAGKGLASSAIDMGKRDWELFRLEQEQTGELVRLQQLRTEGKISESDYMREKGRLEDRFVIKSKAVHDKFLEADRISAEQIKKLKESNEAWLKSTGLAKTGRDGFVYDLAGGMASLAGSIALAALFKSPAAAGVAFGAITGREDYEEALENGKSRETAAYLGFWTGAASMFLEKYGVETIMRPLKNAGIIKYAVRSVITEGSEELTQNLADDGIMTMWGGREKEISAIVEEAILAGVIGGITGGFAGGVRGGFAVYDDTKIQAKEMSDLRRVLGFKAAERATEGIPEFSETARTIPAPPVPGEQQKPNAAKEAENGQQPVSAGTAEESQPQKENTAEAATPEEAGNVDNGAFYVKMAYDRAVNDLVSKCGMTQKAAETYIDRAMAQAADVVGNKIPQILEHELDDATLEGQADEIAAEFRKTVENLGKDRPLSAQFRTELDGIEQKAKEYAEAQGINGKRAELYGLLYRQQVSMWHSITGMSPEYIAERFPVVLQNYNSGANETAEGTAAGKSLEAVNNAGQENQVLDNFDKSAPDNAFVKSRWGNVAHGIITEEIANKAGIKPGEIRVYNSLKEHIERVKSGEKISRMEQIRQLGYDNPIDFIDDVMENLSIIQTGSNGSILLTGKIGLNNTVAIKLEAVNGYYKVTTIMARGRIGNKKTVWEAALPLRDDTRTPGEIDSTRESIGPNGTISIADKSSKNKSDNATSLYQTAYAGSRVDYDRPSLEAIGSGEGAQVHGWGLYYALNRNIAERYRYKLIDKEASPLGVFIKEFVFENKFYFIKDGKFYESKYYGQNIENSRELSREQYRKKYEEAVKKEDEAKKRDEKKGQVHEVDVPEPPYLLDEDLPINEQSEIVRKAVRGIMNNFPDNYDYSENYDAGSFGSLNGREFYKELMFIAQRNGTDDRTEQKKFASRTLEKYGIKGITYDGRRDGRCFVIFNPDDIRVIQKFYQDIAGAAQGGIDGSGPRGATTAWPGDPRLLIELFRSADDSTLPHELAHVFMLNLQRMRALDPDGRVGAMLNDLNEAVGEPAGEMPGTYSEAQQEKFARMFERYLAEGNAPNKKLKRIFVAFKEWLRDIYRTFKGWPELSPAAKRLFDKWLTFDDVANIPDTEALKEYGKKTAALKAVAEAAKESRDTEADGITVQDVKAVLNVTRMARPEEPEAAKAYNETLAIADSITESQAEAENILDSIEDMEYNGARQPDERDLALIDKAIADIQAIEDNPDIEIPGITDTEEWQPQEEAEEQPGSETADRPEAQTVQEEPKPRKGLPGTYVHKEENGTYSLNGTYYVASYYRSGKIKERRGWEDVRESGIIAEGFRTREEAEDFASRLAEMQEPLPQSGGARAERTGLPRRPKHSQTGQALLEGLGFRAVKTGRELTKKETDRLMNALYDGVHDLSEILNIPPESLSLNGTLTVKLGAPKTDIKPGQGAYYRAKDKTIIMDSEAGSGRFAAAWYAAFTDYMKSPEIRPEMAEAFRELEKAIHSRKRTAEEARKEYEAGLKEIKAAEKAAMDAIDSSDEAFALYGLADMVTSTDEYIDAYPEPLEDPVFEPEPRPYGIDNWIIDEATKKAGEKGARLINRLIEAHNWEVEYNKTDFGWEYSRFASDYSTAIGKTTEDTKEKDEPSEVMEEAAFASYIYNRLLERGGRNTFLTRPEGGKTFNVRRAVAERINTEAKQGEAGDPYAYPYPVGRERQAIFNAFDKVFSTLKYETTESGKVRLYQERKADVERFILPEAVRRADERVEPVAITRYFADRKESREISIKDVTTVLDSTVNKNKNGVKVLKHNNGTNVILSNAAVSEMFRHTSNRDGLNIGGVLGKEVIVNLPKIFKNSVTIAITPDLKNNTDNNFIYYGNVIESDEKKFLVKFTIKEITKHRKLLTEIEIEENGNKDLAAYDVKVTNKKALVGNMSVETTAFHKSTDYIVADLIEFVKLDLEKYLRKIGADNGQTLYQSAKAAGDDRNLAVVHNISARAFSKAIDLGGFPVPSIGIINKDQHFYVGGSITLVGDKRMIDPARSENEVYNRDIWSRTFPAVDYRKPSSKSLASFRKKYNPYFERTQETISSILYTAQSSNPAPVIGEFENALAAKVAYIETVQKEKADIELKDRSLEQLAEAMSDRYGIKVDSQFLEEAEKAYSLPEEEKKKAIETAVIHAFEKIDFSRYGEDSEEFKAIQRENLFDKDGKLTFRAFDNIVYSIGKWITGRGKMTADHWALRDVLDKQIKDNEAYHEWAVKTVQEDLLGEPMLRIGRTLKPFTLENITQAMIRGTTKNAQDTLIFGAGKVIAAGAKRLKSIEEIKSEGKKLITPEKALEQQEAVSQIIIDFANKVSKLGNSSSSSVRVSFETAMRRGEAAMRALAKIAESKKPSAVALSKALDYELGQKETYSRELLAEGVKIADTVRGLARDYFEAKLQRAVGLDEFTGAIIPTKGEYDKIAKKAEQAGYKVVRSDNQTEALKTFEKSFFQPSKEPDRFRREDYAWAFRKTGDNRYAISKINSVISSLMKELQKRKIDPETKERITRTLRSAIGYKGYLTRVRQARSLVDGAIRKASGLENTLTEMRPKPVLTEETAAEIIQVRYDPEKQAEIDRKAGVQTWWEELRERYFTDPLTKVARSVSDRAGKISPRLKLAFREFARNFNMQRTAHVKAIEPFLKAYHAMEDNDKPIFDWAAFNGDTETIERLKKKYENLAPALETYRNVLNEIYVQAAEAGFEVGYIQDYFPRKVKNPEALITLIKKTDEWTYIERWLKQQLKVKDPDGWINAKEHQEVIADMISRHLHTTGFAGQGGTSKPGNIKKRRIFEVTPEMMRYYYDSAESAVMYAAEMDRAIQARKFFGYDLQHEEESISMVITDIIEDRKAAKAKDPSVKLLTKKEERELFRDIQSVMHPIGPNNAFQNIKTWGYMFTLVSPISTITQLEDLSVSFAENGIGRTLESATGKKITLEDIGVEIYDPDINSLTGINKYLNTALKATGFSKMDRFGKETFILSDFKKRAEQVRKDRKGFIEECEMYGYEAGRIKNMIAAFEKGDANALNDDAKSLLFYDLAEVQPIDMAEMPEMYLRGENWRIAYALKTFTLKRLNYLIEKSRRYAVQGRKLWDNGNRDAAMQEWIKGIKTMTWTMFLLVTAGASMDWLKDLIMGRQTDIPSVVVDNILKQASFNRWEVKRVAQEGFMDVIVAKTYPVMGVMLQDILTDWQRIYNGSLEMKDMRIWNNIPIVGRFYYWWFGGGKLLTEKQKEKEARKSRTGNRRRKERKDR